MKPLQYIIIGIPIIFSSCMSTQQNSVDQVAYLGTTRNSSDIYIDTISKCFYSPLNMNIEPMEKLMLIDFKGDSIYETIELQVFNDIRGKGATVILYKKNGGNDVYFTDSAFVNSNLFKGNIYENKEIQYSLEVLNGGIEAFVELNDILGRKFVVAIKEASNAKTPTSFLAPVGGIIKTFTYFPLFYMKKFNFVKQSGTTISIKLNNNELKAKKIPLLLNGSFVYLSRYSTEPVLCCVNNAYNGELKPMIPANGNIFVDKNITYELLNNNSHYEIKKISCSNSKNNLSISFSPAIPDVVNVKNDVTISGRFSMEIDSITGIVAGEYKISRTTNTINFTMNPLKAYSPMSGTLWVLAYTWNADITINDNGFVQINSAWIQTEK